MNSKVSLFWQRHPALLYGITLLQGASAALFWPLPWNFIFPSFWLLYLGFLRKWPALFLLPAIFLYCHLLYQDIPSNENVEGIFSSSSKQTHYSPFQKGYVFKGTLYLASCSVPCTIYSLSDPPPSAAFDYLVFGTLIKQAPFEYILKAKEWIPLENSWNFAELRYRWKQQFLTFLKGRLAAYPRVAEFLFALTTGEIESRLMRYEFERIGLQHILGVSGFHFAILGAGCSFFLSLFLTKRSRWICLLLLLNAYFVFLGPTPPVQRCWLMASIYLLAKLCNRPTNSLNLLGFTLGIEIICNPLIIPNIGFQLSFASCFGIFAFHSFFEKKLRAWLPKRTLQNAKLLSIFSKHGYLLAHFLRQTLSVCFAVHIAILPILLVHFHYFPYASLLYNLFYPFLADAALSLLFIAMILAFLFPWASPLFFSLTGWASNHLLELAAYPPLLLERPLLFSKFPAFLIPIYLFLLLKSYIIYLKPEPYDDHSILA